MVIEEEEVLTKLLPEPLRIMGNPQGSNLDRAVNAGNLGEDISI